MPTALDAGALEAAFASVDYEYVVLFGSYARGEAYSNSDVDILLLDKRFDGWTVYEEGDTTPLSVEWPSDYPPLHVVTASPTEFADRYCEREATAVAIAEEGHDITEVFSFTDFVDAIDCE